MTGTLGTWVLAAGLVAAVAAALLWSRAAVSEADRAVRAARVATVAVLAGAAAGCVLLEWALLTHDFSVRYVADNGGRHVPLYFTVTSLWAALAARYCCGCSSSAPSPSCWRGPGGRCRDIPGR